MRGSGQGSELTTKLRERKAPASGSARTTGNRVAGEGRRHRIGVEKERHHTGQRISAPSKLHRAWRQPAPAGTAGRKHPGIQDGRRNSEWRLPAGAQERGTCNRVKGNGPREEAQARLEEAGCPRNVEATRSVPIKSTASLPSTKVRTCSRFEPIRSVASRSSSDDPRPRATSLVGHDLGG